MGLHAAAEAGEAGQVSADYPPEIALDRRYLRLDHGAAVPPFGSPEYPAWADAYFRDNFEGQRYSALYDEAVRIAGRAKNPYAAAVAIEAWFRSAGGFVYDEHPPPAGEQAPLVHFVTRSQRGYCQHFAGAMALMLRYLGIPARVAAGFSKRRLRRGTEAMGRSTTATRDTWVEVWFAGYGWLPFDPTPGRARSRGRTRPPRRGSTQPERPEFSRQARSWAAPRRRGGCFGSSSRIRDARR